MLHQIHLAPQVCFLNVQMIPRTRLLLRHLQHCSTGSSVRRSKSAMSTFTLPDSEPECQVHLTDNLSKEQLLSFPAFKTWVSTLQKSLQQQKSKNHTFHESPYQLRKIEVQNVTLFGGGRIGFLNLDADVSNDKGEALKGAVYLRGGSVAMLVVPSVSMNTETPADNPFS